MIIFQTRNLPYLSGARQTGKTTVLKQLEKELSRLGKPCVLLNLERKNILEELNHNPKHVFKYLPKQAGTKIYILIDEVQYLQDPSHFLKLLFDEHAEQVKIIATGSSAFYMDRSFNDSLAGRKRVFWMKTLDFEEFLLFQENETLLFEYQKLTQGKIQQSVQEDALWLKMEEYMTYGAYPAVVLEKSLTKKRERLAELRDSFIKRDVLESGVRHEDKFYQLFRILAQNTGQLVNTHELSNTLRISNATVEHYLYVLQTCFHLHLLKPFYSNMRKEIVKMPKVYFYDLGLRNSLLDSFQDLNLRLDKGVLWENFIFRCIADKYTSEKIKYWRTSDQQEVDFILDLEINHGKALEVKTSQGAIKKTKYAKFTEQYPSYPLQFLHWKDTGMWNLM